MKKILFSSLIICSLFYTCKKGELPVPKHQPGDVITSTVNLGSDYRYQIFFNLEKNMVVSQNLKTAWDLGFETSENGYRIILNSSKAMYAYNTGKKDFNQVTDTVGFEANKKYDSPDGDLNKTAIGNWMLNKNVYIVDRGYNENGNKIGFKKLQILQVDSIKYKIRYANLDGSSDVTLEITKNNSYNFTFFSFETNSTVIIEPPKSEWDIVFTQYLEALSTPYLVTGVLLNRYNTYATMDSSKTFSEITYDYAVTKTLSSNMNIIGYNWKEYDFNTSSYIVFPKMNYIIKDNKGYYYKLHFIDFYNSLGTKGNPKWEYQKL